mmetsp:Transcript_12352/g.51979  ORF Transcript_12352/g.51979 Transcript_12352/m.51979 type:complete len:209 (+) Transcript_12352:858-1484(+)
MWCLGLGHDRGLDVLILLLVDNGPDELSGGGEHQPVALLGLHRDAIGAASAGRGSRFFVGLVDAFHAGCDPRGGVSLSARSLDLSEARALDASGKLVLICFFLVDVCRWWNTGLGSHTSGRDAAFFAQHLGPVLRLRPRLRVVLRGDASFRGLGLLLSPRGAVLAGAKPSASRGQAALLGHDRLQVVRGESPGSDLLLLLLLFLWLAE